MKHLYLGLAIAGTIIPYFFFIDFILTEGIDIPGFVAGMFANGAAGGFSADVLISSVAFWAYLIAKAEPRLWLYVLLNLTIGLSCALPFYLYQQTVRQQAKPGTA